MSNNNANADTYGHLWRSLTPLYGREEAIAIARLVLGDAFGLSLTDIASGDADRLHGSSLRRLEAIASRLRRGEPVQYVLGHAAFCGRSFHVEPGVLIPRPETEDLCRLAEASGQEASHALDIGTGSGCIAITLALDRPAWTVEAIDISDDALRVARGNAEKLGAEVGFSEMDILKPRHSPWQGLLDIIVSNPPYVTEGEKRDMLANVLRYEPESALFVPDSDPLRFYRAIAGQGRVWLKAGGLLWLEINPMFANAMTTMLKGMGYADVSITDDSFGRHRFAKARLMGKAEGEAPTR